MHKDDGASESESCRPRGSFCLVEGGGGVRSLGWRGGGGRCERKAQGGEVRAVRQQSFSAPGRCLGASLSLKIILVLYVWGFCLHVCTCAMFEHSALRGQKRAFDFLQLELQTIVSLCVVARN